MTGYEPLADAELARRTARGDRAAATELVERHQGPVRAFLRRVCGDAHLADDLAQETMLRMLRHADKFDETRPMRTWLLTIARRLWIDHLRHHARRPLLLPADAPGSATGQPHEAAERADVGRVLDGVLAELSEPQRWAVVLFYQQQWTVEEVAAAMELPTNTIKSHLHRARTRLRELLEPRRESVMP